VWVQWVWEVMADSVANRNRSGACRVGVVFVSARSSGLWLVVSTDRADPKH